MTANQLALIQFDDEEMGDLTSPAAMTRLKETLAILVQNNNNIVKTLIEAGV